MTLSPSAVAYDWAFYALEDGLIGCINTNSQQGVRPVADLPSEVKITDGDGSQDHPYIIE